MKKAFLTFVLCVTLAISTTGCTSEKTSNEDSEKEPVSESVESTEIIGLSDSYNIGVDEEKLNKEVVYQIPDNIEFTLNAEDYGVKANDGYDDTAAFEKIISEVVSKKGALTKVVFPEGILDFVEGMSSEKVNVEEFLTFDNIENLIICGSDTTFQFHGILKGMEFTDCENIMVTGINIDWGRPPFSMGVIGKNDGQTFEVTINEGYPVDENTVIAAFLEYDAKTNAPRVGGNDIYGDVAYVKYLGNQKLEIKFNSEYSEAPEGTKVILRHEIYSYDAITVRNCNNMIFEGVNLYSAPGMGVMGYSSDNLYFNRFNVMLKPDTDRLMSVTADAIHLQDCGGEVKVTNSIFENCGDDAFNAHGAYLVIKEIIDENTVYAENPRGYNFQPNIGDTIEISMASTLLPEMSATVVSSNTSNKGQGFVLELDQELPEEIALDDVIANATRTPQLEYKNNLIRNKRCRGILIQTRNALIENNTFANLKNEGVLITTDAGAWFESLGSHDVTVRNNKFVGTDMGIKAIALAQNDIYGPPGVFKNLTIENNFIANTSSAGICINSVDGVTIRNNLIASSGLNTSSYYNAGIVASYTENMTIEYNEVVANSTADFKGISFGAAVNTENTEIANNTGIDASELYDAKIETLEVAQITGTIDVTDKSLDDWANIGTDMAVNGISDADQNQVTLDDNSMKVNLMKIAWDNDNVYFAFDVHDDKLSWVPEQFWLGDGVEVFMSTNTESSQPMELVKYQDEGCVHLFMGGTPTGGCMVVNTRSSDTVYNAADKFKLNLWEKKDGYSGEGSIPIDAVPGLREAIDNGSEVKFVIRIADSESGNLQIQVSNAPHPVEYNKYVPARMPSVKFVK